MSCDVSIPSIEAHITLPHLQSDNRTFEHESHSECLHHFLEHPSVLPDSVPDDLVEFPGELKITAPPQSPPCSVIRKPPITAQRNNSPQFDLNQQVRELLEGGLLLAQLKHHGRAHQPVSRPMKSLLRATHQKHLPGKS